MYVVYRGYYNEDDASNTERFDTVNDLFKWLDKKTGGKKDLKERHGTKWWHYKLDPIKLEEDAKKDTIYLELMRDGVTDEWYNINFFDKAPEGVLA